MTSTQTSARPTYHNIPPMEHDFFPTPFFQLLNINYHPLLILFLFILLEIPRGYESNFDSKDISCVNILRAPPKTPPTSGIFSAPPKCPSKRLQFWRMAWMYRLLIQGKASLLTGSHVGQAVLQHGSGRHSMTMRSVAKHTTCRASPMNGCRLVRLEPPSIFLCTH